MCFDIIRVFPGCLHHSDKVVRRYLCKNYYRENNFMPCSGKEGRIAVLPQTRLVKHIPSRISLERHDAGLSCEQCLDGTGYKYEGSLRAIMESRMLEALPTEFDSAFHRLRTNDEVHLLMGISEPFSDDIHGWHLRHPRTKIDGSKKHLSRRDQDKFRTGLPRNEDDIRGLCVYPFEIPTSTIKSATDVSDADMPVDRVAQTPKDVLSVDDLSAESGCQENAEEAKVLDTRVSQNTDGGELENRLNDGQAASQTLTRLSPSPTTEQSELREKEDMELGDQDRPNLQPTGNVRPLSTNTAWIHQNRTANVSDPQPLPTITQKVQPEHEKDSKLKKPSKDGSPAQAEVRSRQAQLPWIPKRVREAQQGLHHLEALGNKSTSAEENRSSSYRKRPQGRDFAHQESWRRPDRYLNVKHAVVAGVEEAFVWDTASVSDDGGSHILPFMIKLKEHGQPNRYYQDIPELAGENPQAEMRVILAPDWVDTATQGVNNQHRCPRLELNLIIRGTRSQVFRKPLRYRVILPITSSHDADQRLSPLSFDVISVDKLAGVHGHQGTLKNIASGPGLTDRLVRVKMETAGRTLCVGPDKEIFQEFMKLGGTPATLGNLFEVLWGKGPFEIELFLIARDTKARNALVAGPLSRLSQRHAETCADWNLGRTSSQRVEFISESKG